MDVLKLKEMYIYDKSIYFVNVTINKFLLYKCIIHKCKLYLNNVTIEDRVPIYTCTGVLCHEMKIKSFKPGFIDQFINK